MTVGQKTKVANTNKTTRQHMEEESPQELLNRHGDQPLFVLVSRISPAKRDIAFVQRHQPVVGYGDPMGIGSEITKNMLRAAEGRLAIEPPNRCGRVAGARPRRSWVDPATSGLHENRAGLR